MSSSDSRNGCCPFLADGFQQRHGASPGGPGRGQPAKVLREDRDFRIPRPCKRILKDILCKKTQYCRKQAQWTIYVSIWVCLKMGYTPNEIAIFSRDNDQHNHWVFWGTIMVPYPHISTVAFLDVAISF